MERLNLGERLACKLYRFMSPEAAVRQAIVALFRGIRACLERNAFQTTEEQNEIQKMCSRARGEIIVLYRRYRKKKSRTEKQILHNRLQIQRTIRIYREFEQRVDDAIRAANDATIDP